MSSEKELTVVWLETSWECEECGTIYDTELQVMEGGHMVYCGFSDGHFGNGEDLSDPKVVLKAVLEGLGYTVNQEVHESYE